MPPNLRMVYTMNHWSRQLRKSNTVPFQWPARPVPTVSDWHWSLLQFDPVLQYRTNTGISFKLRKVLRWQQQQDFTVHVAVAGFADRLTNRKACCSFDFAFSTDNYLCVKGEFLFTFRKRLLRSCRPVGHNRLYFSHAWALSSRKTVIKKV